MLENGPLKAHFGEICIIKSQLLIVFHFKKMHFQIFSKWQQLFLELNVLNHCRLVMPYGDMYLWQPFDIFTTLVRAKKHCE